MKKKMLIWGSLSLTLVLVLVQQTPRVGALGAGTERMYACEILSSSLIRKVDGPDECGVLETEISWRVGPENGTEFPAMCQGCNLAGATWFAGRDLSDSYFYGTVLHATDFTGTNFTNANLGFSGFDGSDFIDTNLTNAKLNYALMQNVDMTGAIFTNADLSNADLTGATNLATSSLSGVEWFETYCPDGTFSEDNGDTCLNHLAP